MPLVQKFIGLPIVLKMTGKEITPDMFGTPAYEATRKDISALLNIDDDTVPSLFCYRANDKVQPFAASKRLDAALIKNLGP